MRVPIGTVKTYLHRGRHALRELISEKYEPEELF
jgi:DNA-directed RNA polymerase specialized sigma24 family protein